MTFRRLVDTPVGLLIIRSDGAAVTGLQWARTKHLYPDDHDLVCRTAADEIRAYFDRRMQVFSVPVAVSGTALQRAVWGDMSKIPYGKTETYGDIARRHDADPQAVGVACGQNPIPIIVPCHRIVGADGRLVGYSGGRGAETKQFLIDHETGQGRLF